MQTQRQRLILQATGPEAALLRVSGHGDAAQIEPLIVTRSTMRQRDATALADPDVITGLQKRVAELSLTGCDVVVVLGSAAVSTHRIALPKLDREAVQKAIRLKLASALHYEVTQAHFVFDAPRTNDDSGDAVRYRVAAIHAPVARSICQAVESIGLRLSALHPVSAAIEVLAAAHQSDPGPTAVAYLGESSTTLVVLNHGTVTMTTELAPAMSELTAALMRPIIDGERSIELSETQAREFRDTVGVPVIGTRVESLDMPAERVLPLVEPVLQQWARLFTQWLTFAATAEGGSPIRELRFIGPGAALRNLARAMSGRIPVPMATESSPAASDSDARFAGSAFGPAIGVLRAHERLPDLLPPEIRSRRRVEKGARMSALCGPTLAAGLLVLTFFVSRIAGGLSPALAAQQSALQRIQTQLADHRVWETEAARVARMQRDIDTFCSAVPRWTGVFKEIGRLLPKQLVLRQLESRSDGGGMDLVLSARVDAAGSEREFDALIRDSLLALQRSPFFDAVEIVSASRIAGRDESGRKYGVIEIRGRLIYPADVRKSAPERAP